MTWCERVLFGALTDQLMTHAASRGGLVQLERSSDYHLSEKDI